ncbi:chemotaxis-specific protein-glutamate methyltransferase CheB [Azospirillum sp. RWY-5-1]|uniref:Protein-glutamate methylesterase/protein-glutamine glutaminase n=1 Tax=Azospirillum oleiclasticum TaxID=2735135 RepID=A0ABX2TMC3_9PROT|nr:chemotaxis-specific protein-glutamate methyltransferase CheB [Azospirillum oleiclasticum]NYZ16829.1 chemotaxis-specific protein-glutamate methyltransferase CheB [Azospirillum oleiclasticum]NYZ24438.1 chemotaxis-specific protein-glutamate methyltransferase CheB [Azospirillum oleiclasticum]
MIKVLVVDDSALMRRRIADILTGAGFTVVTAVNGADALERLGAERPDVVTLDITMPGMDGLACLDRIMVERPTPVVMVSALTAEGADVTLEALRLGAVEAVQKPTTGGPGAIADELVETVRAAAAARLRRTRNLSQRLRHVRSRIVGTDFLAEPAGTSAAAKADGPPGLVLVGVSTGGPGTLEELLAGLPADFPWPVVVAQHMPATFTGSLARRLDSIAPLTVVEALHPAQLQPGTVHIARGGADVEIVRRGGRVVVTPVPARAEGTWHPNVDRLVDSALRALPAARLVGVLLTGMGDDGARAMADLKQAGGRTIAESEDSAVVFGMPRALIERQGASAVLPADRIAARLADWADVDPGTRRVTRRRD